MLIMRINEKLFNATDGKVLWVYTLMKVIN